MRCSFTSSSQIYLPHTGLSDERKQYKTMLFPYKLKPRSLINLYYLKNRIRYTVLPLLTASFASGSLILYASRIKHIFNYCKKKGTLYWPLPTTCIWNNNDGEHLEGSLDRLKKKKKKNTGKRTFVRESIKPKQASAIVRIKLDWKAHTS